jgi:8-oxo-dGTP pyrophosphatase MutT (NUDIX family)
MDMIRVEPAGFVKDTWLIEATFRLPDGSEKQEAIVDRLAAVVAVVPLRRRHDGKLEVLLVRRPRLAGDEEEGLIGLVAGNVDAGEVALDTAFRVLAQQAGLQADVWDSLGGEHLLPASGFLNEPTDLFVAYYLNAVPGRDEVHTGEWVLLNEAIQMVLDGTIRDMSAMLGLLLVDKIHHQLPLA